MKKKSIIVFLCMVLFLFSFFLFSEDSSKYSLQEVRKVLGLIEKIEADQLRKNNHELKKVEVTESELNSYIAYRIEIENEEVMKELRLKMFEDNKLEGKIFVDLKGQNLPRFLRPEMTFYAGGKVEVKNGKLRFLIKKLFFEDVPVDPKILDLIILVASKIQNFEASNLSDWYDIPYGIRDIKTKRGKAIFYY